MAALLALALASLASANSWPTTADAGRSASHVTSTASGQCSKAEAIAAVKRLGLRDASPTYPVYKVLCGAFTGPGSRDMVASISGSDNVGMLYWAVFRWSGSDWQLVFKRRQAAVLTAAGSDIKETVSIYRPGDSRCCPSGGTKSRIWHWNGSRFVAGPYMQVGSGSAAFRSPSGNIECGLVDDGRGALVECWTFRPPQKVKLYPSGRLTLCRGSEARCKLANIGEEPTLTYGTQLTVGRFRCQSLQIGVRCTVIQSGKGFLINRGGVTRVGP